MGTRPVTGLTLGAGSVKGRAGGQGGQAVEHLQGRLLESGLSRESRQGPGEHAGPLGEVPRRLQRQWVQTEDQSG